MDKKSILLVSVFMLLLLLPAAFAQECTLNGKPIPCDEMPKAFGLIFAILGIVGLAVLIFWVWMLIDCIKRDFENKVVWILILVFTGILGAIIYYFVVKRKASAPPSGPPAKPPVVA